jgi:hypothetical protein
MFVCTLAALVVALSPYRSAAATWSVQTGAATGGTLSGVSCISTISCIAIGRDTGGPISEIWNGTSWRLQEVPAPREAVSFTLYAVSCATERFCVTVGYYTTEGSSAERPLVEAWDGSTWTIQPAPLGNEILRSVSCTSERACTAVGYGVRWRWNGTEWRSQSGGTAFMEAVSCTSETFCMGVGTGLEGRSAASSWNGASWSNTPLTAPEGALGLISVSCSSSAFCMAMGIGSETFGEQWNGREWRQERLSFRAQTSGQISCKTERFCAAADRAESAVFWNGSSWTTERLPLPEGGSALRPLAVSCTSTTACTLVGGYRERLGVGVPLIERYS